MNKKTKTCVPRLRFPEFAGAGEWEEREVGDVLIESVIPGSKGDVAKKLTVKLWAKGVYEKIEHTPGSPNTQYYKRKAGQFIYSQLDFLNQAFGIIPEHLDDFESTVDLPCFDIAKNAVPFFLLQYIIRDVFYKKYGEIADGGRKARRIQVEVFSQFPIFLPPTLPEQQKIADCLASLDTLLTAHSAKLDALKEYKKGLLQYLFPAEGERVPRLRFPEFAGAGEWEERKLGELLTTPPDYGINAPGVPFNVNLPKYLRITDISDSGCFIDDNPVSVDFDAKDSNYLHDHEIVLARTGASVGKAYKYRRKDGKLVFAGFLIRLKPNTHVVDSEYLFNFFFTDRYKSWVEATSGRGAQPGINSTEYASLTIPVPKFNETGDIKEQQRIADCLSSLDSLITAQGEKITALKEHKKGLLQQLFPQAEGAGV